jgi:hypothetical protein
MVVVTPKLHVERLGDLGDEQVGAQALLAAA